MIAPVLTPRGRLQLEPTDGLPAADDFERRLADAFERGHGHGLVQLGAAEVQTAMPPAFRYWREFASGYFLAVRSTPGIETLTRPPKLPPPPDFELASMVLNAPAMRGSEYLSIEILQALWSDLDAAFHAEAAESGKSIEEFLKGKNPNWNLVGRVHFNLAENRNDDEFPFAFLATYTHKLSSKARAQHLPLGRALTEYSGSANKPRLLSLLLPVQRAAEACAWLQEMVSSGEIFHPLRWAPDEALRLLNDIPVLESSGVIVRIPASWRSRRPAHPKVSAHVGEKPPSGLGADALLDFRMDVTLDGEALSEAEIAALLSGPSGLRFVRGRWIEVDRERLGHLIEQFHKAEEAAADGGISFGYAMRLLSGVAAPGGAVPDEETARWTAMQPGPWLSETLEKLRHPDRRSRIRNGGLNATLRSYQQTGVGWLDALTSLGLGACLADDMGLGKTMQVLALLNDRRESGAADPRCSLLVAPASLLANWTSEIERFAPKLRTLVVHPSAMSRSELLAVDEAAVQDADLAITSYGSLLRVPALLSTPWNLAIIDEAQAIKNPGARQTRLVKQLKARARIALTGTPIENKLGDLWSIFDFINPGLLGSGKEFTAFSKRLAEREHNPYAPLRELVRPYILRRLKTDKTVISDLPEKTEVKAYCQLAKKQAALYKEAVDELAHRLQEGEDGIERRGMILAFLMRFKQICNHPSQWLGDGNWAAADSGKLPRLREIAEVVESRQEKMLVFTQFREVTGFLADFLESVFGRRGLVLHGETEVRKRQELVRRFQEDETVPFFVLSLKAGGTGLNLTAASHVVHFDRWWNPAVENQATDRAFRIGQKKNVLVHKFICRGTLEEKIDALIDTKQGLSKDMLEGGREILVTEMSNEDILRLVALDIHAAAME